MKNLDPDAIMNNPPAFPQSRAVDNAYSELRGMTLRDYFAAKAMAANLRLGFNARDSAVDAYEYADAMLKVRDEQT